MADIGVACVTCSAYLSDGPGLGKGICRRNPPHPFLIPGPPSPLTPNQPNLRIQSIWPPVAAEHWCGQHDGFGAATSVPIDSRLAAEAESRA